MLIKKLIDDFADSSLGRTVIPRLKAQGTGELFLHGITDNAKSFFLATLLSSLSRNLLFLANDSNSALLLYHEIKNLTDLPVFYFSSQEVSPYDQILSDSEIISNQAGTISHLLKGDSPCLIISTTKYLLGKLWNKTDLEKTNFVIDYALKIEPNDLAKKVVALGYNKVALVNNRGEFSVRGDIFDVFPMIGEPTRIEFIGDVIDSIRTYNPTTQRSQANINSVLITPRYYLINTESSILENKIKNIVNENPELAEVANCEIEQIKINNYPESIEYYSQLLNQSGSSLFDYLPNDALIVIDDWEANTTAAENWYKRNLEIKFELEKNKKILPLEDLLLFNPELIVKKIKTHQIAYIERFDPFDSTAESKRATSIVNLSFSPAYRFHNQINEFIEKIKEWVSLGNKIIIFSDQPQRVKGILKEWNIPSIEAENLKNYRAEPEQIVISKGGTINGFVMNFIDTVVLTDQEIFGTKRKPTLIKKQGRADKYDYYSSVEDLKINDCVVHVKHGIGKYRGLVKMSVDTTAREYLMIEYAADGKLYLPVEQINLLYRYRGSADVIPRLSRLGGADWELTKKKVKKAVKKIAEDLLNLYTARAKQEGFAFHSDMHWQIEMEEAFPYTETPDQWKAICDTKADMESLKPMDRLICGDVGYGKTEVAIRAIFKAVLATKQAAVLVPTTILAQQHYNVISERLAAYPVRIGLLSRFVSAQKQKEIITKLALGEIDIVIGTHRIVQKDVVFKDLGIVVIDEEQRFGVIHKERLKQLRIAVDVLTLSATPIPRTLHMALSGAKDMSLINTPPPNRLPIKNFVGESKPTLVKTAVLHELERGGQVYFVHNRIESIYQTATYIKELVPESKIAIAHGQMKEKELENIMLDFWAKKYNVLVCTTIIESGLDIPNVNTIIIDNADQLGLSQLYQLRGRVGRSEVQAHAYFLYSENKLLTDVAKSRLQAIKEFSSLGSGYQIALRDMEIRGVGNILGAEQHGHMISVGFDLYCQLLNEAIDKLKGLDVQDLELETVVDLSISAYIPSTYIEDEQQKVLEYKRLAGVKDKKELEYLAAEWRDRFGALPVEVENLTKVVEIRIFSNEVGIKNIKSDMNDNVKIDVNLRLDRWLSIHNSMPRNLAIRTAFKPSARGGSDIPSSIMLKVSNLNSDQQFDLIFELLKSLKTFNLNEKIA